MVLQLIPCYNATSIALTFGQNQWLWHHYITQ